MDQDQIPTKSKSNKSEYLQPFVVAFLASIFGFAYSFYYYGNFGRALGLAGIELLFIFWIVLRGNRLVARREKTIGAKSPSKTPLSHSRLVKLGLGSFAFLTLIGIAIFVYQTVREANDRRAKAEQLRKQEEDDLVIRTRKVSFYFFRNMSNNPHPSFESGVDAAIAALKFPIDSIEKNWPTGPTIVVYKGTAKDAAAIHQALRSQGVPVN